MLKIAHPDASTLVTSTHPDRLAALYRSFGPIIYARCRRALQEEAAATAATHEVFVLVLPSLDADPRLAVKAIASACERVCQRRSSVSSTIVGR